MRALLLAVVLALVAPGLAAAQPGVSDTEIVLGASTALSGPLAFTGEQQTRYGIDLYFKTVNEQGGVAGRRVRTVYHDDGSRSWEALANTRKLVEQEGVLAIIGPQGTSPVAATLDYLEAQRVPLLFPFQGSPIVRGRAYVFGGMTLWDRQARMTIDYLVGPRKYRRLAVIYQDDAYGQAFRGAFEKDLARHRLKLAAAAPVTPGTRDVSAQMARLKAARPDVLLLALVPDPAAEVLKERRKMGWSEVLVVSSGPLTDERYLAGPDETAEGVEGLALWPDPVTSDLPGVKAYREAMLRYFPKNGPSRESLAGYVAGLLFTEGARRAGRALTRDSLVIALRSITDLDTGILPPLTVGPDQEPLRQGFWARLEKRRLKPLSDWLRAD